jgi:hypothetical protein
LRNSEGWNWATPRAVDLGAEDRHQHEQGREQQGAEQAQPPRLVARQHRDGDHHRQAGHDPHQLAVEIMERRVGEARARITLAGGRRRGGDGDEADRDQHRDEEEEDAVDLPEPAADRASIGAAQPVRAPALQLPHQAHANASTAARKASPRAS